MKVLAKLRRGVLEVTAGNTCVYAHPTFWQRAYLVWTFRNFRRLSVRVLNQRQRQLVESLCDRAHSLEASRIDSLEVIGRAEFVKLPTPRPLDTVIVRQMGKTHPTGSLRNVGQARLPRDIARPAANAFASSPIGQTRSHARYSLVLSLALASLFVISGAVAQRLWTNRGQASTSSSTPSPVRRPAHSDQTTGIQAVAATPASSPVNTPSSQPAAFVASQASNQAAPIPNKVKAVAPASESVHADVRLAHAEANTPGSRLRVFLAPRSVIYPSLPNLGSQGNVKKQILVTAMVNPDGNVDEVQVPGEPEMVVNAIRKSVRQWRYQPYVLHGQPVEVETHMVFTVLGSDAMTVRFLPPGENPD